MLPSPGHTMIGGYSKPRLDQRQPGLNTPVSAITGLHRLPRFNLGKLDPSSNNAVIPVHVVTPARNMGILAPLCSIHCPPFAQPHLSSCMAIAHLSLLSFLFFFKPFPCCPEFVFIGICIYGVYVCRCVHVCVWVPIEI